VGLRALDGPAGRVAAEVIRIDLAAAATTAAAASIVLPLVRSDLPVFLRWRGPLPDDAEPFGSLLGVADRLIVDAREWPDPDAGYARLRAVFDQIASSDISWRRLEPWRRAIAACRRPGASFTKVRVGGPAFEARLLAAWLTARLGADIVLEHREADRVTDVALDGEAVRTPRLLGQDASELLSCELDQLTPDPIFEEAVCALSSVRI
jgi:glucose-6-phosphate dehydrogenase assembly protein OpcA